MKTKTIAYSGVFAALYFVLTVAIAPLSYGPIQLRMSALLNPIALLNPAFGMALALGTGLANLFSPFGFWDWGAMPIIEIVACLLAWQLRRRPIPAILAQSVILTMGVCLFPLGQGAHLPFAATFSTVLIPNLVVPLLGYIFIWRREDIHQYVASDIGQLSVDP